MNAYSSAPSTIFVKIGVKPHLIFMTAGQLGIPRGSGITPPEMGKIRRAEAEHGRQVLQASLTILDFLDMNLASVPFDHLIEVVLPLMRKINPDALFSFNPENQPFIDHTDHTVTGMLAKHIGAAINVAEYHPQFPAPPERPELYLWTTHTEKTEEKIYSLPLSKKTRQKHNEYLKKVHPSQFQAKNELEWIPIFEALSKDRNGKHTERYIKIR